MKWLLKIGCPLNRDPRIFEAAAKYCSLLNMKWLLEKGCPIYNPMIFAALRIRQFRKYEMAFGKRMPYL